MNPIRGTLMYEFQQNLRKLKEKFHTWNKEQSQDIFQGKKLLKEKLEEPQREGMNYRYTDDVKH